MSPWEMFNIITNTTKNCDFIFLNSLLQLVYRLTHSRSLQIFTKRSDEYFWLIK